MAELFGSPSSSLGEQSLGDDDLSNDGPTRNRLQSVEGHDLGSMQRCSDAQRAAGVVELLEGKALASSTVEMLLSTLMCDTIHLDRLPMMNPIPTTTEYVVLLSYSHEDSHCTVGIIDLKNRHGRLFNSRADSNDDNRADLARFHDDVISLLREDELLIWTDDADPGQQQTSNEDSGVIACANAFVYVSERPVYPDSIDVAAWRKLLGHVLQEPDHWVRQLGLPTLFSMPIDTLYLAAMIFGTARNHGRGCNERLASLRAQKEHYGSRIQALVDPERPEMLAQERSFCARQLALLDRAIPYCEKRINKWRLQAERFGALTEAVWCVIDLANSTRQSEEPPQLQAPDAEDILLQDEKIREEDRAIKERESYHWKSLKALVDERENLRLRAENLQAMRETRNAPSTSMQVDDDDEE